MRLILASGSSARRAMLQAAGVKVILMPADVDESAIKAASPGPPESTALQLAVAKAARISAVAPGALVIGADQILVCEGKIFSKPGNLPEAATQLRALRGKTHALATAACVVKDGETIWSHIETPHLAMRNLSDTFLDSYLSAEGEKLCACVGAYRLEGPGIQLFNHITGDYFTILGLPLLPLLAFLRTTGAVRT